MTKPTPSELQIMLNDMKERSEERHTEYREHDTEIMQMLREIKEQTLKTNGRVNKHDWYFKAMWWALGGLCSLSFIIIPLLWRSLKLQIEIISNTSAQKVVAEFKSEPDITNAK